MLTWLRKRTKVIMISVAVVFVATMFYGLGYSGLSGGFGGQEKSNVIAKVNGKEIDQFRFNQIISRLAASFGKNVGPQDLPFVENLALSQAIEFNLMLEEANRKVRVSGEEINGAVDGVMRQQNIPSKRELESSLKKMGLSFGKFRGLIKDDIAVQKLTMKIRNEVKVTPDDYREIRASHILLSNEAGAKMVMEKIKQGGDFAKLAKQYSIDPGSAAKGGDLGYFGTGMMVMPFEKAAFSNKIGEVSGIVQTPFGYHIIKVADSRLRKIKGKEKEIESAVLQEKQEKVFRQWFSEIRNKAKIEIISPEMKANDLRFKGRLAEAVAEYRKAAAQNPANPYIHLFLGDTLMAMGQKADALQEYENAVRIEGNNPQIYIIVGKAYDAVGEKALAAEQFKKASLIAGDDKAMHESLLKLFQQMKKNTEVAREKTELKRIEKKEKFEKELRGEK